MYTTSVWHGQVLTRDKKKKVHYNYGKMEMTIFFLFELWYLPVLMPIINSLFLLGTLAHVIHSIVTSLMCQWSIFCSY